MPGHANPAESRRIDRNTLAYIDESEEIAHAVLYSTTIASAIYYKDGSFGLELNSGGWSSSTTKDRLNKILSGTAWRIQQIDFQWYAIREPQSPEEIKTKIVFEDGMTIGIGQDPNDLIMKTNRQSHKSLSTSR